MKAYAAPAATECAMEAVQIMGGNGYMREFRVEQLARDAKLLQIGGGTDEIQLITCARALLAGDMDSKRQAVTAALEQARITDLPRTPDGRHIAADLMAFYFRSSDANDLCYRAAIGRDLCRGLDGSEQAPPPLKGRA